MGYRLDISGEARWLSQPNANFSETGLVFELGYYLTPSLRLAAGYSFGGVHDNDFNGTRSAGGAYLGISLKLDELFTGFGLQRTPAQPQPATVKSAETIPASEKTGNPAPISLGSTTSETTAQQNPLLPTLNPIPVPASSGTSAKLLQ